ncbi:MAG TPA: hypothetical protein VJR47_03155 [Stellaceae bacterium]|nr:hypothetical protein [Stellaceae bacterium]
MKRIILFLSLLFCLAACADDSGRNAQCARERPAGSTMRWGYFPGYGCGPVPRAQTNFSALISVDLSG